LNGFAKEVTHQSFAAGQIHQVRFESNQPTGRNDRFDGNAIGVMIHAHDFAFASGK